MRAAHPSRGLEKVEGAIGPLDELAVGDPFSQPEGLQQALVEGQQGALVRTPPFEGMAREHPPLLRRLQWRGAVTARDREPDSMVRHQGIDMKDVAWHESFEDEVGLLVAQLIQRGPEPFRGADLPDPDRGGLTPRLEHPRARHSLQIGPDVPVIDHRYELGHRDADFPGPGPHRQLVPEIASGGVAHAPDPEMLAKRRRLLHVEIVECHDPVEFDRPRQPAHAFDDVGHVPTMFDVGYEVDVVNGLAGPLRVLQTARGQQQDPGPRSFGGQEERVALVIAGDTEQGQGGSGSHLANLSPWPVGSSRPGLVPQSQSRSRR